MSDSVYYQRRLAQELAAAQRADCPKAAAAHRELAEIYRLLMSQDESQPMVVTLIPEAVELLAGSGSRN